MLKTYRNAKLTTKLLGLLLVLGIVLAYNITNTPQLTLTSIVVTGALAACVHILIQYPRFSKFAIACMIQLGLLTIASLLYGGYFGLLFGVNADLAILTASSALVAATLVLIYLTLSKARGSIAVNLILSFILLDFSGLTLGLLFGWEYLLSIIVSIAISVGFVLVRSIDFSKNKITTGDSALVRETISNNPLIPAKIIALIKKHEWEAVEVEGYNNFWVINTGNNIVIATGIALDENVKTTKTGYVYENIPLENIIAELAEVASTISQEYKIPRTRIHFAVIDVKNRINLPAKGYQRFELSLKKEKTNVKTRMVLASSYGMSVWVEKVPADNIIQTWENFVNRVNNPAPKKVKKVTRKKESTVEVKVTKAN